MNLLQAYLEEWDWAVRTGLRYDNRIGHRCNEDGGIDCSGGSALCMNRAAESLGLPDPLPSCENNNSYSLSALCHQTARPQWLTDAYGSGNGTGIPESVAMHLPGVWWFHGNQEGQAPDSSGDGHIETGTGGNGNSVGAHSHATGVGYSNISAVGVGFFTWYAIPPPLLDCFAPPAPKVEPMFRPPLTFNADLKNPQGGRWEGRPDGTVRYVTKAGDVVEGGMVTPADRAAFAGRELATLTLRWYKSGLLKKAGYTITATSGEQYIPQGQH